VGSPCNGGGGNTGGPSTKVEGVLLPRTAAEDENVRKCSLKKGKGVGGGELYSGGLASIARTKRGEEQMHGGRGDFFQF